MAPSNLNQVFISNTGAPLTGSTFLANAALASTTVGVWDVATGAYLATSLMAATGPIQIVQSTRTGNSFASPLIDVKNIKRIAYTQYQAPVRHSIAATFGATVPTGQSYIFKVAIRTYPTMYEAFVNPTNPDLDLSGGNKTFPLLGNFSAGRTVIPVVEIAAGTTVANAGIAVTNAIQANKILNDIFTVSDNGAGVVTVVARHMGVIFDVACNNTATNSSAITATAGAGDAGVGSYLLALSDEKSQRARYGNFNRMYFPMPFDTFASSANTYEVVEISYAHDWPSSTGIARAGELNNIKIYSKVTAAASTTADTVYLGASAANWGATNTDLRF
jgi:hypothetical protein